MYTGVLSPSPPFRFNAHCQFPATIAPKTILQRARAREGANLSLPSTMIEPQEIIEFAAVLAVTEQQIAGRAGIFCGSLRVLSRVSALSQSGAHVRAADVIAAKAAAPGETRQNLKRLLASGHLERKGGPVNGRLVVPEAGRKVLAELVRGMHRARRQLVSFEPCPPFRRTVPKKKVAGTPVLDDQNQ